MFEPKKKNVEGRVCFACTDFPDIAFPFTENYLIIFKKHNVIVLYYLCSDNKQADGIILVERLS
jgi:hypothetical protein